MNDEQTEPTRLGETFRQVREAKRISIADLAANTGIDAMQINLEGGRLDPKYDELLVLASGLDVRVSALIPRD